MPKQTKLEIINAFAISLLRQNSLDDLLWSMAENIGNLLDFEDCVIYLKENNTLVQMASVGIKNPQPRDIKNSIEIKLGNGIVGTVATTGIAEYIKNVKLDKRYIFDQFSGQSEICVPLLYEDNVIGIIDSESSAIDGFSKEDVDTLKSIATIAAPRIASAIGQRDKKKVEINLRKAKKEAEQANLAKSDFLASMSHELRTPMHGILSFAELGVKRTGTHSPEKIIRYFKNIQVSGKRLLHMLNELLDLSKLEARKMDLKLAPNNLLELINSCIQEQSARMYQHSQNCKLHTQFESASCHFDLFRIHQVIANIISNAIKFNPERGKIDISLEQIQSEDGLTWYQIKISDEGPGIPKKDLKNIFNKFYQSSQKQNEYSGTGLGLTICHEIIELHKGEIWAENNSGKGCSVIFKLPESQ